MMNWILYNGITLIVIGIIFFFQGIRGLYLDKKIIFLHEHIILWLKHNKNRVNEDKLPLNRLQRILIAIFTGIIFIYIGLSLVISPRFPINFFYFENLNIREYELIFMSILFFIFYPIFMYYRKQIKILLMGLIGGTIVAVYRYIQFLSGQFSIDPIYYILMHFIMFSLATSMVIYFYIELRDARHRKYKGRE